MAAWSEMKRCVHRVNGLQASRSATFPIGFIAPPSGYGTGCAASAKMVSRAIDDGGHFASMIVLAALLTLRCEGMEKDPDRVVGFYSKAICTLIKCHVTSYNSSPKWRRC